MTVQKDDEHTSDLESDDGELYEMETTETAAEPSAKCGSSAADAEEEGMTEDGRAMLAKLKAVQRQAVLSGQPTGSISANDRLMKELRDIYRSEHYKNGKPPMQI